MLYVIKNIGFSNGFKDIIKYSSIVRVNYHRGIDRLSIKVISKYEFKESNTF